MIVPRQCTPLHVRAALRLATGPTGICPACIKEEPVSYSPSRMNISADPHTHEEDEGYMGQAYHAAEHCVQNYPTAAVLVSFGAAFALGYMLAGAMVRSEPQRGRLAELGHRTADFGHKTWEALAKMMPETIAQRMQG